MARSIHVETKAAAVEVDVATWEDDPGERAEGRQPITVVGPEPGNLPLPIDIAGIAVPPRVYDQGTAEFRYWVAAEAVARGITYWAPLLPAGTAWSVDGGGPLGVILDGGADLNAYYDRKALNFFHYPDDNPTVFSGESPQVVCHELGHAVLDAIKPDLWDAGFIEAAAFHEAFGDMSATLSVLQNDDYRALIAGTVASLSDYSRLSRTAEQLGEALRQLRPDKVEAECLRCLTNSWFYEQPAGLPPMAPAWLLSSEPHSFSRVFTGAFLDGFAEMVADHSSDAIGAATEDMGKLLVAGVLAAPVVPSFYAEVAFAMLVADQDQFSGKYLQPLAGAFVRHGILALTAKGQIVRPTGAPALGVMAVGGAETHAVISGGDIGLRRDLHVPVPTTPRTPGAAASAADFGPAVPPHTSDAARAFIEDLLRRNRVDVGSELGTSTLAPTPTAARPAQYTHRLVEEGDMLVLRRAMFDCRGS